MSTNDNTTTSTCAACGKEGDNLKSCVACKLVKYCNRYCQVSHRRAHKKMCKKRAAELYDEQLFKEPSPPKEECPICFIPSSWQSSRTTFQSCCGKCICNGCMYAMEQSEAGATICPFCRMEPPRSNEEGVNRIQKCMDKGITEAFNSMAGLYGNGRYGLPQDLAKARELYLKAGKLGFARGYFNLALTYDKGIERDEQKAKHYYELAAMNGHVLSRHNLGVIELKANDQQRALKHFIISAKAGDDLSLDPIKQAYQQGAVTKDEYANILRTYQTRQSGMKSNARDKAESHGLNLFD